MSDSTNYSLVIDGRRCWFRDDGVNVLGPDDTSRDTSNIWWAPNGHHDYVAECASCWLGHSHSLDYHNAEIRLAMTDLPAAGNV